MASSQTAINIEAELTGGLEHPGIVPVYGLGSYPDGRPYYAMRFIRGDNLKDAIARFHKAKRAGMSNSEHNLIMRELLDQFVAVCNAIAYAHSRGVLHRDLKPGNIMLGKYGETLVVDWGLAKVLREPATGTASTAAGEGPLIPNSIEAAAPTRTGCNVGTPQYMSPEQAAGRVDLHDFATDIYGLGATLYCILTGLPPVNETDVGIILQRVQRGDFPKPTEIRSDVPAALEAVCLKAMALKPENRYATPGQMADDIKNWLADVRVTAYAEPITEKLGRWIRQHMTIVSGLAASIFVGSIALISIAILYQNYQAEATRKQSLAEEKFHQRIKQARNTRAELHKILTQPGGIQDLLSHPTRWQAQIESARADWHGAKDHVEATLDSQSTTLLKELEDDLARDQADYELARDLEDMALYAATIQEEGTRGYPEAAARYAAFFKEKPLLKIGEDPATVAARLQTSAVRLQLVAALDDWGSLAQDPEVRKWLFDVTKRTDPHSWRNHLRDPALWKDIKIKKINQLLQEADAKDLSPQALRMVTRMPTMPFLRLAYKIESILRKRQELGLPGEKKDADALELLEREVGHPGRDGSLVLVQFESVLRNGQKRHPSDFWSNFNLANELVFADKWDDAIAFYRAALTLRPDAAAVHYRLGLALYKKDNKPQLGEAIHEMRRAIDCDPKSARCRFFLGIALRHNQQLEDAIPEFRSAIELNPKETKAYATLGETQLQVGHFSEARESLQRCLKLLQLNDPVRPSVTRLLQQCDQYLALDQKLAPYLEGKQNPSDDSERLTLARFCQRPFKKHYVASYRFYAQAFANDAKLVDDMQQYHRYNAACAAALASAGKGVGAEKLNTEEQTRLRKQVLIWLQIDLSARAKLVEMDPIKTHSDMQHWQRDADLASLRDKKELVKLPAEEHAAFTRLWGEVDRLAKQARASYAHSEHQGQLASNEPVQSYPIRMTAGKTYVIDMESPQFDTYLRLEDDKGKSVAENDDISPTNRNSRIVITPSQDGAYSIVATSYKRRGLGTYTVTVREFASKK